MDLALRGEEARDIAERLIRVYFKTQDYPYTRHHIESYDQFLSQDLPAIIGAANPITLLEQQIEDTTQYAYKAEIYVGGYKGEQVYIGTPTVSLKDSEEVRLLFPNEARLRNLTYAAMVQADIVVKITYTTRDPERAGTYKKTEVILDPIADPAAYGYLARFPIFRMPIMLHSRYCVLHGKPQVFLKEAGECQYDQGGYFVVNGSEKILITHQQQAFNTLYINKQDEPYDPKVAVYASMSCLNPTTRQLRRVAFGLLRKENVLQVSIPFVRKPVPIFVLFRALGITSDEEILRTIFPDADAAETKLLEPLLHESILEAFPFYDTYSAVQYIKVLTKGFSEAHVLHILNTELFVHVENRPKARAAFLAECVRRILRVSVGIDPKTDRDDTRNQRCLTSGVLIRQLFQELYVKWKKAVTVTISSEYKYHESNYEGRNYQNLFIQGTMNEMLKAGQLTEGLTRAFRGKWSSGSGAGVGEEKSGVIQALSRLSFLDFMSHCRRVVLDFDTGMKLASPRRLHTSQYGYFCTNETPNGASIGVSKNLGVLAAISTATDPGPFVEWLYSRGGVYTCEQMTPGMIAGAVPVFVNNGIVGYSFRPLALRDALRALKWTGCLSATTGIGFSPRERRVFVYMDEGRPVRPLIHLGQRGQIPVEALRKAKSWRDLIMGVLPVSQRRTIYQTGFIDPLESDAAPTLENYVEKLAADAGVIEYMDPYEMNEAYIANFPEHIQPETSHMEIHPSTIVGLLTSMIPYANHNQSPRNQLSCSQSKQGISTFSTAFQNRYDNQVHVMCYAQAPLSRTIYYDYLADGQIGYGTNLILAMGSFTGYNQDDGILMNADSVERGMFRSTCFRSYEAYEEDDPLTMAKTRIGNPIKIPGWTSLKPGVDYTKLDERGIVRVGELVDENSVLVGRYLQLPSGELRDNSVTAQVWTRGRVEKISVTVSPTGMTMVKVRVVQERIPELGDKFCLTPDHEVLTKEKGWVSIQDVEPIATVAQLNRDTGVLEYTPIKEKFEFDHQGDMYEVKTQGVNLCTTLNHRMWVQGRNQSAFGLATAKEMMGKRVRFSSYSPTGAPDATIAISPEITLEGATTTAFLRFFGIWIAEGWVYSKPEQYIRRIEICANKPRVKAALEEAATILELETSFNAGTSKYYINSKPYVSFLEPLSVGALKKYLPSWCFELSQEQSLALLDGLCLGDGHETASSLSYSTSSKQLRDDIQVLVQHAGYTSSFYKHVEAGSIRVDSQGRQYKANADNWHIQIRRKRLYPTLNYSHSKSQGGQSEEIIQYSGKVYCLSVPSEVFLVRRAGTIVWTGNSNRHGQKGTIGMLLRGYDMPRTRAGIPVDMMMNPHAIPSRMTMAQLLEMLLGRAVTELGAIGNATPFMNEGNPGEQIGAVLRDYLGMEPMGEELLYDGMSGQFIPGQVFLGNSYTMRLKHMPEDKWNARGEGRREQRTHQPTAGRGAQGGLRVGEMERDAYIAHGISGFIRESFMKRADGYETVVCNGCGTIPIYNEAERFYLCPSCDGPVQFSGDSATTLEILPANKRSVVSFSRIEIPYSVKLLDQEMNAYMNMGMRFLTDKDLKTFRKPGLREITEEQTQQLLAAALPERKLPELDAPEYIPPAEEEKEVRPEDLAALGAMPPSEEEEAPTAPAGEPTGAVISLAPPQPPPQAPNNGLPTIVLSAPVAQNAAAAPVGDFGLEEADIDAIPAAAAPPLQQGGGVNVQTSSQPVLVVPVNVGAPAPAPPAEMYSTGIPGAPTTFAVDTSPGAMQRIGLPPLQGAPARGGGGSRSSSRGSSGGGAANARVTVNKMGGSSSAQDSAPNVRVMVTKTG